MTTSNSPKRTAPASKSIGARMFITAASLATLVGGWAALALGQASQEAQKNPPASGDDFHLILDLPPLPTLVPEPSAIPTRAIQASTNPTAVAPTSASLTNALPSPAASPYIPTFPPPAYSPTSTPGLPPLVATLPPSASKKGQADPSGKGGGVANKPARDPVTHSGSSK